MRVCAGSTESEGQRDLEILTITTSDVSGGGGGGGWPLYGARAGPSNKKRPLILHTQCVFSRCRDLNVQWLRAQIGLVGQMPKLFSGTIREV